MSNSAALNLEEDTLHLSKKDKKVKVRFIKSVLVYELIDEFKAPFDLTFIIERGINLLDIEEALAKKTDGSNFALTRANAEARTYYWQLIQQCIANPGQIVEMSAKAAEKYISQKVRCFYTEQWLPVSHGKNDPRIKKELPVAVLVDE